MLFYQQFRVKIGGRPGFHLKKEVCITTEHIKTCFILKSPKVGICLANHPVYNVYTLRIDIRKSNQTC